MARASFHSKIKNNNINRLILRNYQDKNFQLGITIKIKIKRIENNNNNDKIKIKVIINKFKNFHEGDVKI